MGQARTMPPCMKGVRPSVPSKEQWGGVSRAWRGQSGATALGRDRCGGSGPRGLFPPACDLSGDKAQDTAAAPAQSRGWVLALRSTSPHQVGG